MRIATISHFFESHGGGIERVAARLCLEFARAGHESIWVASASDPAPRDSLVIARPVSCLNPLERITGIPMPIPGISGIRVMARAIRQSDAVIVHDALYCTSVVAAVLAYRHRKPVILVQHIADVPFASPLLRMTMRLANALVTRRVMRHADQVVFISEAVRHRFAALNFRRPPRLLFNGVDTSVFHPGPAERERFGLEQGQRVAVFAGRLVEKKGLAVIEVLARRRPDLTFVLAGTGPIHPASWQLPNVRAFGALAQDELASLFRSADLLLLPSVGEGFPLVIQEAMACGLPVVCGDESAQADPQAAPFLRGVSIDLADAKGSAARVEVALSQHGGAIDRQAMARYAAVTYSWPGMAAALADLCAACARDATP